MWLRYVWGCKCQPAILPPACRGSGCAHWVGNQATYKRAEAGGGHEDADRKCFDPLFTVWLQPVMF